MHRAAGHCRHQRVVGVIAASLGFDHRQRRAAVLHDKRCWCRGTRAPLRLGAVFAPREPQAYCVPWWIRGMCHAKQRRARMVEKGRPMSAGHAAAARAVIPPSPPSSFSLSNARYNEHGGLNSRPHSSLRAGWGAPKRDPHFPQVLSGAFLRCLRGLDQSPSMSPRPAPAHRRLGSGLWSLNDLRARKQPTRLAPCAAAESCRGAALTELIAHSSSSSSCCWRE